MAAPSALSLLIEQAQERVDEAARILAKHISQRKASQDKLQMLQTYRQEYQQRLEGSAREGVAPHELLNFRDFIAKLDTAITQQENEVGYWDETVQASQQNWLGEQRKLKSYDVLDKRRVSQAQDKENKLQQKQNDEFSMNSYFRKQTSPF